MVLKKTFNHGVHSEHGELSMASVVLTNHPVDGAREFLKSRFFAVSPWFETGLQG
jgi:hypothetical protein